MRAAHQPEECSLEFIAGLLFPLLALSAPFAALAAQSVRLELPECNEGDW